MREEYDFSDAKRENPYLNRIQQHGYAIVVNCGAAQSNSNDSDEETSSGESVAENKPKYSGVGN